MAMKITTKLINTIALLCLITGTSYAQNQGDDTPLGAGGTRILCNTNEALTSKAGANGKLNYLACKATGEALMTSGTGATSLGKADDAAHTSGDTGVFALTVRNSNLATFSNADGDYQPIASFADGGIANRMTHVYSNDATAGPVGAHEDSAAASGDTGIAPMYVREDALTSSASANGDYINGKADGTGRQMIGFAPPGETWQSCGTSTASTADVAIKAAVASNRIYVTSLTCKNTDAAVAPNLDFKDGSTIIAVGAIIADSAITSANSFVMTFPIPLRGTVNTAFNFAANTATSSVICCGAGYISVN